MKLFYNKITFACHWFFDDDETTNEWTEKVPEHTNQIFCEELNEWTEKEIIKEEN